METFVAAVVLVSVLPGRDAGDTNQKIITTINKLDKVEEAMRGLEGAPIVMKPVDRPYGMREMVVKDPSGFFISFAQRIK